MPTPTYIPLATVTLGTSATTINFNTIRQDLRDLIVVINGTYTTGAGNVRIRFNSDSTNTYLFVYMAGGTGGIGGGAGTNTGITTGGFDSTTRNSAIFQILDYSATDKHKIVLSRSEEGTVATYAWAGRWPSTAAVNTVSVVGNNPFAVGTTINLYGVIA